MAWGTPDSYPDPSVERSNYLIGGADNRIYFFPRVGDTAVTPTSASAAVTDGSGSAVTISASPTQSGTLYYLDISNSECDTEHLWQTWEVTWNWKYASQDFVDVYKYSVVEDTSLASLVTIKEVKDHLGITDSTDDEMIAGWLSAAQATLGTLYDLPTVPRVTEQRKFRCNNKLVLTDELSAISAVYDSSAVAITAYTILYGRRPTDFYRGILLTDARDEDISVSGTWGYDKCPGDVRRALIVTTATWYKRSKLGADNDVIGGFASLPREAKDLMEARRTMLL